VGKLIAGLVQIPLLTLACAAFYAFMPNVKVHWRAALAGGVTAGILWYLNNTLSTKFVSQLTRNQAIYGSLAAVPVFMVGLYFFWMLLLFGAQVAYTFQNRRSYLAARQTDRVNQEGREFAALRVMIECARDFVSGAPAPSVGVLAERLAVPNDLVARISTILLQTRLLVEVNGPEIGLAPGRPPHQIRVADVVSAMRRGVGSGLAVHSDPLWARAERELAAVGAAELAAGGRTLAELAAVDAKA
jgi:membrane protein